MSRVTLVNPPGLISKSARFVINHGIPPIGLAYIAGALKQEKIPCTVIDAVGLGLDEYVPFREDVLWRRGISIEEIVNRIPLDTTVIGLASMFSCEWLQTRLLARAIREKFPSALIVVGGEHATGFHESIIKNEAVVDACILGEGEETLLDLAKTFFDGKPWKNIAGISWKFEGETGTNPRRTRMLAIDNLLPDWEQFPVENYLEKKTSATKMGRRSFPILATRGCPYSCVFCTSPQMWGTKYVTRTPAVIIEELKSYIKAYGVEHFCFVDLTATIQKKWFEEFCTLLVAEKLNITWEMSAGARSEIYTPELLTLMKASGLHWIGFSAESAVKKTIERIKKKTSITKMEASIREAIKRGFRIKVAFIIGLDPGGPMDSIKSVWWAFRLAWWGVHDIAFYPLAFYPGTEVYKDLVQNDEAFRNLTQNYDAMCEHLALESHTKVTIGKNQFMQNSVWFFLTYGSMFTCFFLGVFRHPVRIFSLVKKLKFDSPEGIFEIALYNVLRWGKITKQKQRTQLPAKP